MFWEIGQDIKNKIKMTFLPAMRNLLSSWRSLVGMLLVMLILQMLLGVICISGIENIKSQMTVLRDFGALIESSEIETATSGALGGTTANTAMNSTSIFIGAVIIWGICAIAVYQKITFASADRDKYIWGMYVTHGAGIKKVKSMLKCELYAPHLLATAVAYPLALLLCNRALSDHGYSYSHSFITLAVILVLSYICIRLVVEYQCFIIKRMSCVDMLREEDSPKSICFPRRHSRLIKGFTPLRYALSTFLRMRKYYVSLAAIAAIPALIWICFHVSATSEDAFLTEEVSEFKVSAAAGIDEDEIKDLQKELANIDGISSVDAEARYPASKIYTHILADGNKFTTTSDTPFYTSIYADNSMVLCCADTAFAKSAGLNVSKVSEGKVTVLYPKDAQSYNLSEGTKLTFAVSKLDGSVRAVTDPLDTLTDEFYGDWEYITLTVGYTMSSYSESLTSSGFLYVDKTYIFLSDADYKKITSISPDSYRAEVPLDAISYDRYLDSAASFNVTLPASALPFTPKAGDILELYGQYSASVTVTQIVEDEADTPEVWEVELDEKFAFAYVNSVSVSGDVMTLNVSPQDLTVLEAGRGPFPSVMLAFGTPVMQSDEFCYFPATAPDNIVISNTSVTLLDSIEIYPNVTESTDSVIFHTSSAVRAAEAGTHVIVSEAVLPKKDNSLFLESLYADCSFEIACADGTTSEKLGIDVHELESGEYVLVLPSSAYHYYNFSVGDKLRLAITLEDVSLYDKNSIAPTGVYDMLAERVRLGHDYAVGYITDIIYSDSIDTPYVFTCAEDFSTVIAKSAPYISFDIYIDSGIESERYAEIREKVNYWATGEKYQPRVTSTGAYLNYLLRKTANYSTLIMLISSIIPLIVPFIWYYPLATLHDRRRTEFAMLDAMGKRKRTIRLCFAIEGLLVTLCAFLTVLVLCYPTMFVFKSVCVLCKLPLEFEYSALSLPVLLVAGAFSAASAAVSFAICHGAAMKGRKKSNRIRRKYANT